MPCGCNPGSSCTITRPAPMAAPCCGLSVNTAQPSVVNRPIAHVQGCCESTIHCDCSNNPIPHFPLGVSQLSGEVGKYTWNF
jgi:hypothetical protein